MVPGVLVRGDIRGHDRIRPPTRAVVPRVASHSHRVPDADPPIDVALDKQAAAISFYAWLLGGIALARFALSMSAARWERPEMFTLTNHNFERNSTTTKHTGIHNPRGAIKGSQKRIQRIIKDEGRSGASLTLAD